MTARTCRRRRWATNQLKYFWTKPERRSKRPGKVVTSPSLKTSWTYKFRGWRIRILKFLRPKKKENFLNKFSLYLWGSCDDTSMHLIFILLKWDRSLLKENTWKFLKILLVGPISVKLIRKIIGCWEGILLFELCFTACNRKTSIFYF